ncbi:MAG: PEGA domain-containing protein, partial [Solirubrobacteraceae bacterium]|nr:PEGA domain-containing protein [Solirubrobacteraceae bacterium]
IRSTLPDCNIPAASLYVPPLIPTGITQPCTEGETKTFRCPDGTEIVIARCTRDPVTGINVFVPTGEKCPAIPPPELGKIAKILTYPVGAPLEAFDGMDVTITASVVCGTSPSSGETAIFLVDGNEISRGTTSGGFVSFTWKATVEPSRTHKLCVSVPKSSQCSQFGEARDCKTITVSRAVPDILERLKKERESYLGQLEAQRIAREKIREISLTLPQQPYVPEVTTPTVPEVPIISIPVLPPVEQVPGIIDIPAVTAPPGVPYPIEIRIDGNIIGPPPVYKEVTPGTHTITISLKGFTPISKKVSLTAGQILTIEEGFI